jgi:hypothetical protein
VADASVQMGLTCILVLVITLSIADKMKIIIIAILTVLLFTSCSSLREKDNDFSSLPLIFEAVVRDEYCHFDFREELPMDLLVRGKKLGHTTKIVKKFKIQSGPPEIQGDYETEIIVEEQHPGKLYKIVIGTLKIMSGKKILITNSISFISGTKFLLSNLYIPQKTEVFLEIRISTKDVFSEADIWYQEELKKEKTATPVKEM